MGKVKYLMSCVAHMDYGELFRTVGKVHKITGKNSVGILADVVKCGMKYGAGFNDYLLCEFYNLTDAQRATYITRSVNNTLVALLNNREYYHFFDNKSEFYQKFAKYIGRQWLDFSKATKEEFASFMADRDAVMVKPDSASGGKGVEKLFKKDFPTLDAMYDQLKADHVGVVEDVLQQHPQLNQLNSSSINTLRIVTILNETGPHIVYAHIRIGNSDRPVDNLHSGGMFAPIDLEKGVIQYPAYDKARHTYTEHPRTHTKIQGFAIPYWEESKAMCLEAAQIVPQMRYVGWDVAITPDGPVFVEGNNLPGYDILQMPPHTPDKIGMLPRFREFVKGI
ncbi:MAG: sugar-transfer associated ATP-grasp domain-containing protein [Acutalibacter sp.]|jgi:glutathione synthase/RimK-type ligase-like ATP-grasp enzyme